MYRIYLGEGGCRIKLPSTAALARRTRPNRPESESIQNQRSMLLRYAG